MSSTSEDSPCGICKILVQSGDEALECDICSRWIHISCSNTSVVCYNTIQGSEGLPWLCNDCKVSINSLFSIVRKLQAENLDLHHQLEEIRECVASSAQSPSSGHLSSSPSRLSPPAPLRSSLPSGDVSDFRVDNSDPRVDNSDPDNLPPRVDNSDDLTPRVDNSDSLSPRVNNSDVLPPTVNNPDPDNLPPTVDNSDLPPVTQFATHDQLNEDASISVSATPFLRSSDNPARSPYPSVQNSTSSSSHFDNFQIRYLCRVETNLSVECIKNSLSDASIDIKDCFIEQTTPQFQFQRRFKFIRIILPSQKRADEFATAIKSSRLKWKFSRKQPSLPLGSKKLSFHSNHPFVPPRDNCQLNHGLHPSVSPGVRPAPFLGFHPWLPALLSAMASFPPPLLPPPVLPHHRPPLLPLPTQHRT